MPGREGFAEGADDALDDPFDFESEVEVVNLFERKLGDVVAKFFGDLPLFFIWVLADPLGDAQIDARPKGLH